MRAFALPSTRPARLSGGNRPSLPALRGTFQRRNGVSRRVITSAELPKRGKKNPKDDGMLEIRKRCVAAALAGLFLLHPTAMAESRGLWALDQFIRSRVAPEQPAPSTCNLSAPGARPSPEVHSCSTTGATLLPGLASAAATAHPAETVPLSAGWTRVRSSSEFSEAVQAAFSRGKLVVLEAYAPWCPVCTSVEEPLNELIRPFLDRYEALRVNVDEVRELVRQQGVERIPTVLVFREGAGRQMQATVTPARLPQLTNALTHAAAHPLPAGREWALSPVTGRLEEAVVLTPFASLPQAQARAEEARKEPPPPRSSVPQASEDPKFRAELGTFLQRHGAAYGYGLGVERFNALYAQEVGSRMKPREQHYLDYTGAAVYTKTQLENCFASLQSCLLGNPHSENPSSHQCEERVEDARARVLRFFNADPDEYQVVFTSGATGALKIVGEYFPWSPASRYRYLVQNHNSVLGIREYAKARGARFEALDAAAVERWLAAGRGGAGEAAAEECEDGARGQGLGQASGSLAKEQVTFNLWAYPAEENYAGAVFPLEWIDGVRRLNELPGGKRWLTLLDAAAYVPTRRLDLSQHKPDFLALSFYKVFGYPTGLGALIVRTDAAPLLNKKYWGGGSVSLASSTSDFHMLKCQPSERLEDGTVSFLDIAALQYGFDWLQSHLGGVDRVTRHTEALREYLFASLSAMRHTNGRPVARIFGQHQGAGAPEHRQGAIVNFELLDPSGRVRPYKEVERRAGDAGIHLRTGCSCNPGACNAALGITDDELRGLAGKTEGCGDQAQFARVARAADDPAVLEGPPGVHALRPAVVYPWEKGGSAPSLGSVMGLGGQAGAEGEEDERTLPDGYRWVSVPLGSIRVSMGYMSRFEDAYAFLEFVRNNYVDK